MTRASEALATLFGIWKTYVWFSNAFQKPEYACFKIFQCLTWKSLVNTMNWKTSKNLLVETGSCAHFKRSFFHIFPSTSFLIQNSLFLELSISVWENKNVRFTMFYKFCITVWLETRKFANIGEILSRFRKFGRKFLQPTDYAHLFIDIMTFLLWS